MASSPTPHTVSTRCGALYRILPSDIAKLIGDQVVGIVHTSEGKKGVGLVIALAIALYGGSNGAGAVITALNIAYEQKENAAAVEISIWSPWSSLLA